MIVQYNLYLTLNFYKIEFSKYSLHKKLFLFTRYMDISIIN